VSTSRKTPDQFPKSLKIGLLPSITLIVVLVVLGTWPATAQDRSSRNHNGASLHIEVNIVPSINQPRTNPAPAPKASVEYVLVLPLFPQFEITTQRKNFTFVNDHGVRETAVLVVTTVVLP
jgi:hypothetical protein